MSAIRLYVDEDASEQAVIRGLRARAIDVLTTAEADNLGAADPEQLAFAAADNRTIYTFNVGDFARLHREYLEQHLHHSGIVVLPDQRCSVGEKILRVARFIQSTTAEKIADHLEYL